MVEKRRVVQIRVSDDEEIVRIIQSFVDSAPSTVERYFIRSVARIFSSEEVERSLKICLALDDAPLSDPKVRADDIGGSESHRFGWMIYLGFFGEDMRKALPTAARLVHRAALSYNTRVKLCATYWLSCIVDYAYRERVPLDKIFARMNENTVDLLFLNVRDELSEMQLIKTIKCFIRPEIEDGFRGANTRAIGFLKYGNPGLLAEIFQKAFLAGWGSSVNFTLEELLRVFLPTSEECEKSPAIAENTLAFFGRLDLKECADALNARYRFNEYELLPYIRFMPEEKAMRVLEKIGHDELDARKTEMRRLNLTAEDKKFIAANKPKSLQLFI